MALIKITDDLMQGKGVINLPDVPGLTTEEMQAKFDELARDVIAPAFNANVEALQAETATQEIGAAPPTEVTADPLPQEGQPTKLAAVLQGIVNFCKAFVQSFAYSKKETNEQINAKVVEIGTGDMAQAVYDTNSDGIVNGADNGIMPYLHTKAGTVHDLAGTGENIKFIATENYLQGDTFSVNNKAVWAKNLVDFKSGDVVSCFLNGVELDFGQAIANQNMSTVEHWTGEYNLDSKKLYEKTIVVVCGGSALNILHGVVNIGDFKTLVASKTYAIDHLSDEAYFAQSFSPESSEPIRYYSNMVSSINKTHIIGQIKNSPVYVNRFTATITIRYTCTDR